MAVADWEDFISSFNVSGPDANTLPGFITNLASGIATGAAAAGPLGAAVGGLESVIQNGIGLIGRGRREADIIVPVQNQFGTVLTNVNAQMNDPGYSVGQLAAMYQTVVQGYAKFDAFTRDARFTDGRASVQARNTIRPLVDGKDDQGQVVRSDGGTLGNLEKVIIARGGTAPGNVSNGGTPGQPNTSQTLATAGSGGGLLWAGAAVLGAKLLGVF